MKTKENCYNCKFRADLNWDAHSKCLANWQKGDHKQIKIEANQWTIGFPNNFAPVWVKKCKKFEEL
jgi:hypothetical protein